jgi:hypothetical protein
MQDLPGTPLAQRSCTGGRSGSLSCRGRTHRDIFCLESIMNETTSLAEQHIREWESRLKHIDELVERASGAQASGGAQASAATRLAQMREDRDRLALEVRNLRERRADAPHEVISRSSVLKATLDELKRELYTLFANEPIAREK